MIMASVDNTSGPVPQRKEGCTLQCALSSKEEKSSCILSALFQSHGGRDISSLVSMYHLSPQGVNCALRISGLYTSRLLDAVCKKVLNLLKKGLLKVEATLKSAWTEKDQIDNLLKERRLMRSLEKFVDGRLYEGGLWQLQRTI
ncbi:hypothetical protein Tco_0269189 [Tanacetum coccineum]